MKISRKLFLAVEGLGKLRDKTLFANQKAIVCPTDWCFVFGQYWNQAVQVKVLRYLGVTLTIIHLLQESPDRITLASGYFRYSLVLVGLVKSPLML